ncbi:MAG: hypothetical protein KDE51_10700 [Anaerolineales bacterium]|nr:hypothetical protein [Anaerolineales bacterium]
MRLGILNACSPADEAEFGTEEFTTFQAFFALAEHNFVLTEYRITEGHFPATPHECDGYLITGSPKGVYDDEPWIKPLEAFINRCYEAQQKLVGICFGHQMLAHALGGRTEKSDKGWGIGLRQFEILEQRPWMNPPLEKGALYFAHQDQVMQLPPNAQLLAGDSFCPNTMFTMGNQVLGVQGHPEFTRSYMGAIVELLRPYMDETTTQEGLASLEQGAADNKVMAQWIVNFLQAD